MNQPTDDSDELVALLAGQEERLVFDRFDESLAWSLGVALVEAGLAAKAPVVIDIRSADRTLFHAALPGSAPDNDHWARRKSNLTLRLHKSSMLVGEELRRRGREAGPEIGLDPLEFASHGGSFPVRVKDVGVVAAVTVSGLPQRDDHDMVVAAIARMLGAR